MQALEQRRRKLLDGKRTWRYQDDYDVFFSEFVPPFTPIAARFI